MKKLRWFDEKLRHLHFTKPLKSWVVRVLMIRIWIGVGLYWSLSIEIKYLIKPQ